jgi:hypothetical protein
MQWNNNKRSPPGSRFRLAIIPPREPRFISEFRDTEFRDSIETRTSTAVAAIFPVCFVACSLQRAYTRPNKKKAGKKKERKERKGERKKNKK